MDLFGRKRREEKLTALVTAQFMDMAVKAMSNRLAPINIGGIPIYPANNTKTLIEETFEQNITFYSVITRIAQKFGHLPRYVYKPKADEKQARHRRRVKSLDAEIIDSDLSQLLLRPNDEQGQDLFFETVALFYLLTGEAFLWKNRGGTEGGIPLELQVLPTQYLNIIPDKDNYYKVAEYELNLYGQRIRIPKEDIIHWKRATVKHDGTGSHLRGFNPLQAQNHTITQANAVQDAATAMFQNGGARGVFTQEELTDLSPEQVELMRSRMDKIVNNKDVKSAIAFLQSSWKYHDIGKNAVDMQLLEADEALIKKICNANGLPYELFQSDTTFANKKEAWYFFITNTLMPMAASLDAEMTRGLIGDFKSEKGQFIKTDFFELPEMQEMRLKAAEALKGMPLTPDEIRMMLGFEPLGTPEMQKVYIESGMVPIDEATMGPEPNQETGDYDA